MSVSLAGGGVVCLLPSYPALLFSGENHRACCSESRVATASTAPTPRRRSLLSGKIEIPITFYFHHFRELVQRKEERIVKTILDLWCSQRAGTRSGDLFTQWNHTPLLSHACQYVAANHPPADGSGRPPHQLHDSRDLHFCITQVLVCGT